MAELLEGELIKAPSKKLQNTIAKINDEHLAATDSARIAKESVQMACEHAIRCGLMLLRFKAKCKSQKVVFKGCFNGEKVALNSVQNATFLFDYPQATRYMKAAKTPKLTRYLIKQDEAPAFNLDRTCKMISEASADVIEKANHNHRAQGTGQNEWFTPVEYVNMVRSVMGGIDLDPATSETAQAGIMANRYFTIDDDGLKHGWYGRVWLNPPYSQPDINYFIDKLVSEHLLGVISEAILLTHNYTDTAWFHMAEKHCASICFTRGRIAFINDLGEKAAPTQGQLFFYFGGSQSRFKDIFSDVGCILSR